MKKLLISIVIVLTIAACGGGGGGTGGSSGSDLSSGLNAPDIRPGTGMPVQEFTNSQGYLVKNLSFNPIYIGDKLHGRGGTALYYDKDNYLFGVRSYEDSATGANIIVKINSDVFEMKFDGQVIPELDGFPTGTHQYKGYNTAAEYTSNGNWLGIGTFAMNANFASGQGYIKARTIYKVVDYKFDLDRESELEGYISINTNTGIFFGHSLNLTVENVHSPAFISGSFHGRNASGVTGFYAGLGDNYNVEGGIAGRSCSAHEC